MNRRVLRSVAAVPLGWVAGAGAYLVVMIVIALFNRETFQPGVQFSTAWLLVTLFVASVCWTAGGFVTGVIAQRREIAHAVGLVFFALLVSVCLPSGHENATPMPNWYLIGGYVLVVPSPLLGGWLRMKQRILLSKGSERMISAMDHSRFAVALLVSFIAFVLVMFWGTVLGAMGLLTILQSFLGKDYHTPVMLPVFIVCFILASILSRRVFRRIMPRDTSLMNDRRQE